MFKLSKILERDKSSDLQHYFCKLCAKVKVVSSVNRCHWPRLVAAASHVAVARDPRVLRQGATAEVLQRAHISFRTAKQRGTKRH